MKQISDKAYAKLIAVKDYMQAWSLVEDPRGGWRIVMAEKYHVASVPQPNDVNAFLTLLAGLKALDEADEPE